MNEQADIDWPAALADYEPIRELSVGRISTVVAATEADSGRRVAVKILHDHLADEQPVRDRLRREFAAVRRLDHPAIVRAEGLLETDETVALVMEYVDGDSVRTHVEDHGPMDFKQARPILDDVLAGLDEAHRKGILHRDLNAEHVLIDDQGNGRIVGFGLARVDELAAMTMHTRVLGAMEATAPERLLGMDYDGRADLYSVGAVAHELLVGHPPSGGTLRESLNRADDADTSVDTNHLETLPAEARYLIERSLVSDPTARFATADQMRSALDGDYDRRLWNRWASRETRPCPECSTPIIDGLLQCIDCGHEFRRLVQNPGGGDKAIMIISPKEAFDPDFTFEKNYEPDFLKTETVESLMELLDNYEDTSAAADWSPDYRWPPYVLFDRLDEDDAARVASKLEERDVPCRVLDQVPSRRWRLTETVLAKLGLPSLQCLVQCLAGVSSFFSRVLLQPLGEMDETEGPLEDLLVRGLILFVLLSLIIPLGWAFTEAPRVLAVVVLVIGVPIAVLKILITEGLADAFAALATVVGTGALIYLDATTALSRTTLVAAFMLFVASHLTVRAGTRLPSGRREVGEQSQHVEGLPLMISSDDLLGLDLPDESIELPDHTARVLQGCSNDEIRTDLHDLLVLAVAVGRRTSATGTAPFDQLVDEILTTGERLDELTERLDDHHAAQLVDELEGVEAALEADDADTGTSAAELEQQRDQLLEDLEAHDRTVRQATRARTTLQRARGQLMKLLGDETSPKITLDFDDSDHVLAELADQIDAEAEVRELTTVQEPA